MSPRPRILYLAPCRPSEKSFGTQLRTSQISGALQEIGEVDCVVVAHIDQISASPAHSSTLGQRSIPLQAVAARSPWERLRCQFDARFVRYYGYSVSEKDRISFFNELGNYDLVWLHNLRTANVFDRWNWPKSVMDLDDVPSSFLSSVQHNGVSLRERLRARLQLPVARRREALLKERFTVLSVCSDADRQNLGGDSRIHIIPNGFPTPNREPLRQLACPPRIGFIGVFGYLPNARGVEWFAKECWPLIKRQVPDARLRLAGEGSDGPLKPIGPDIDALGWVGDASAEIATWSAMIVPVKIGAGTRIKIAEGFSRKCPIVSTSLGAYGYEAVNGREMFLADSPETFANACIRAIRQPAESAAMAERAWRLFLEKLTWEAIRPRVHAVAEDCLRRSANTHS